MASTAGKVITCRAAVSWEANKPLVIEEITVDPPKKGEVRIQMVSASMCQTDLCAIKGYVIHGFWQGAYPVVPGHEGAGIVESVGPEVTSLAPGDHVLPLFGRQCNKCALCKSPDYNACMMWEKNGEGLMPDGTHRLKVKGKLLYQMTSLGLFSEYTVCAEDAVAKVRPDVSLKHLAPMGCGVPTGMGAVLNEAKVWPGATCAVFGLGGVGLAAVLGCKLAGASVIVGVDINPGKAAVGRKFGCTDIINPKELDRPISKVLVERFNGGCDFTFEVTGNTQVMRDAFESARHAGGRCVVVGGAPSTSTMSLCPVDLLFGRRLSGCMFGGYRFRNDVPSLVDKVAEGKIPLDDWITHSFKLEDINKTVELMKSGECIRAAISFS